jgi:gliding motility-associated lipoprotein GldD
MVGGGPSGLMGCRSDDPVARPFAYARAVLPPVVQASYTGDCIPVTFEYNAAAIPQCINPAQISQGSERFSGKTTRWMNLRYSALGAQWHISYHPVAGVRDKNGRQVAGQDALSVLMAETQRMSFKHTLKATAIEEKAINYPQHKVYGILYVVGGDAASQTQFYVTDSIKHFLRGSLYFGVTPNSDSLKPYSAYLLRDMQHSLETLRWQ